MKLMVMGHGRHGKDTVCEILRDNYGFTFQSSSFAVAQYAIYPILKQLIGYDTLEECYNDRHNHRSLWFELIKAFNHRDKSLLSRLIFQDCDIYCGIRNVEELNAARKANLFDYAIWVTRSQVTPEETTNSCTVTIRDADYVLDNNGTVEELQVEIDRMVGRLRARKELDKFEV